MAKIVTALGPDNKVIGIEYIFTIREDGKQIYDPVKYDEIRKLSEKGLLRCEECGERLLMIAPRNWTKEQHFRHYYEDQDRKCLGITEGKPSIDSRKVLKCWLSDKLRTEDIEVRVPINSISDSNRKFEFSFLSEDKKVALCYWYTGSNINSEKLQVLDENKKDLKIIHVLDENNSGCPEGQFPIYLDKIQKVQGFVLFLSVENADYTKATLRACIYRTNIDGLWEEITFAKGNISRFYVNKDGVSFNFELLSNRALAAGFDFASDMEEEKAEREAEEAKRKAELEAQKAYWEKRRAELEAEAEARRQMEAALEEERQRQREEARQKYLEQQEAKKRAKIKEAEEREKAQAEFMEHLEEKLSSSEVALTDFKGMTWIQCRVCGKVGNPVDFATEYNGEKRKNPGICKKCQGEEDEKREKLKQERIDKANTCEKCGRKLVIRRRKADGREFYACPNYDCHYTKSIF